MVDENDLLERLNHRKCEICKAQVTLPPKHSGKLPPRTCESEKCKSQYEKLNRPIISLMADSRKLMREIF